MTTNYLQEIPGLLGKNNIFRKEYDNQVGYLGNKLIENRWLTDNAKLNIISHSNPELKLK